MIKFLNVMDDFKSTHKDVEIHFETTDTLQGECISFVKFSVSVYEEKFYVNPARTESEFQYILYSHYYLLKRRITKHGNK